MKKIATLLCAIIGITIITQAQSHVKIESYKLANGLKVVLAEEHSQPQVFGGILVHAGSKNEDTAFTGVAHYFEHMMFKGTDRIGTTNWAAESLYLDSISNEYDHLQATKDPEARKAIQQEINRLNIAATRYAIPNEVDAILSRIGSTGVNAGTSYDYTVYYNTFPSNQMENWMDIYVERFRYPVFRLFQSELEAVYEEKNMYEDSPIYGFQRQMFKESFGEHPYSRDVIGLGEHLKNPQPSAMRRFFDTYYVANNMSLVLVGDFDINQIKPLIEEKFSTMRSGQLPAKKSYRLPTFENQRITEVKMTPIPMGMIIFPGVPANHPDELPLSVLSQLLSGGSGILDRASTQGQIMMAAYQNGSLEDAGLNLVIYVPNLLKQSHADAEKVLWDCFDSIKQGRFSEELLQSIKTQDILDRKTQIESLDGLASLIQQLELTGSTYEQWVQNGIRIQQLTRQDIIALAKKYLDPDHCTIIRSKMGFPAKDQVDKPNWDHLQAQNIGAQSDFAADIYSRPVESVKPQQIIFGKDVEIHQINSTYTLYTNNNPKNDIFNLTIGYDYGTIDNPDLDRAANYFNSIGAKNLDLESFNLQLQLLGASMSLDISDDESSIVITGYDENLDKILDLVSLKFKEPRHDQKQIQILIDAVKAEAKTAKSDADTWFSALQNYVRYGQQSSYLRKTPIKQWQKNATPEHLLNQITAMFNYGGAACYTGNLDPQRVTNALLAHNLIPQNGIRQPIRSYKENIPADNQVFFVSNKKFGQSNIMIILPSREVEPKDRPMLEVFNEYFGAGMNSIIFQEIREFRSLGYSTYGIFRTDPLHINGGKLMTFLGTQSDKTLDGTQALNELMTNVPLRADKFTISRDYKVLQRNGNYIGFRSQPTQVSYWERKCRYTEDPTAKITAGIPDLTLEDMQRFIEKYILGQPKTIIISGNAKRFNTKELEKYGTVHQLKQSDIMTF